MNTVKITLLTLLVINIVTATWAQPKPDLIRGGKLFKTNCGACHGVKNQIVGPPLGPVNPELMKRGPKFVLDWVHDSQKLVNEKDSTAVQIFNKYGKIAMPSFPTLTGADLFDIRAYLDEAEKSEPDPQPTVAPTSPSVGSPAIDSSIVPSSGEAPAWLYAMALMIGLLILVMIVFIVVIIYFNTIAQQIFFEIKRRNEK